MRRDSFYEDDENFYGIQSSVERVYPETVLYKKKKSLPPLTTNAKENKSNSSP